MKKYQLIFFVMILTINCWSQLPLKSEAAVNLNEQVMSPGHPDNNTATDYGSRALGDIIWSSDFTTASDWTAAGPSSNYSTHGWSVGTVAHGWYFGGTSDMGTTGNFARFINGNPTIAGNIIMDGPFTFTYNNPIDLTGIVAPHLEFEQYGARFITLQAIEVSTNGGATWIQVGSNSDIAPLTSGGGSVYPKPQTRSFNISTAIVADPSNVMVRLLWDGMMNGPSMNYTEYGWYVDNVRIVEGANYNSSIQAAYFKSGVGGYIPEGLEYYLVPESQVTSIQFSATTFNDGGSTFTGLHLITDVEIGANLTSGNSANIDLLPNNTDSLFVPASYTPVDGIGVYNMTWYFEGDNADEVPSNDTIYDYFEVTNSTYARDNGIAQGSITNVSSNVNSPFQIGNIMEVFGNGFLDALSIKISSNPNNAGQLVYGTIYKYNTTTFNFDFIDYTDDYTIQGSDLDNFVQLDFSSLIQVYAGDILLICAGHYGGTDVSFGTAQLASAGTVLGFDASGNIFSLLNPKVIMVRASVADYMLTNQTVAICDGQSISVGSSTYSTSGIYTDTLTAVVNGADSVVVTNLTVTNPYENTQNVTICDGEFYLVGSSSYTAAGNYSDTLFTVSAGCDSIIHTNLSVAPIPDLSVTQNQTGLTANLSGATYQWVDCNNGNAPVSGQTSQTFVPSANGSYAVIIDDGICSGTSTCFTVSNVGIAGNNLSQFKIYPNPTNGNFTIEFNSDPSDYTIRIIDNLGRVVQTVSEINSQNYQVTDLYLVSGVYYIELISEAETTVVKLIIE